MEKVTIQRNEKRYGGRTVMIREVPYWVQDLTDKLEDDIEDAAQERGIRYRFVQDSEKLDDALNQIRHVMERLDNHTDKRDTEKFNENKEQDNNNSEQKQEEKGEKHDEQ